MRINTTNDFIVYCSLSSNVCNIGLQCNLQFLSITVLQGSVATRVNYGRMFNDFCIANLLLSVMVKEFWRSVRILQSNGKKYSGTFFRTQCIIIITSDDFKLNIFLISHKMSFNYNEKRTREKNCWHVKYAASVDPWCAKLQRIFRFITQCSHIQHIQCTNTLTSYILKIFKYKLSKIRDDQMVVFIDWSADP